MKLLYSTLSILTVVCMVSSCNSARFKGGTGKKDPKAQAPAPTPGPADVNAPADQTPATDGATDPANPTTDPGPTPTDGSNPPTPPVTTTPPGTTPPGTTPPGTTPPGTTPPGTTPPGATTPPAGDCASKGTCEPPAETDECKFWGKGCIDNPGQHATPAQNSPAQK